MSDQKPAATWHPHASREEALAAGEGIDDIRARVIRHLDRDEPSTCVHSTDTLALIDAVRILRDQRDALVAELARARGCTENVIRCAHGIT